VAVAAVAACAHAGTSVADVAAAPVATVQPSAAAAEREQLAQRLLDEGVASAKAGDDARGVSTMLSALDLRPSRAMQAKLYRNIGVAYVRLGDRERGCVYLKAYAREFPDEPDQAQLARALPQTCP